MTSDRFPPEPGDLLGWIIFYGNRHQFRVYIPDDVGETKAQIRAGDLHGEMVAAVVPQPPMEHR